MFELQVRPIDNWPRPFTVNRQRGNFTLNYGSIMRSVEKELTKLGAKSAVLLMDLAEDQIRLDGRPKANAKPNHPGVILVVDAGKRGTLRFPCDRYTDWVSNLRAISLHLDALRRIDRYGVSVSGEQYKGWAALESPNGDHWNQTQAMAWLDRLLGPENTHVKVMVDRIRLAEFKTHPDKGGNPADFNKVQTCRKLLLGA